MHIIDEKTHNCSAARLRVPQMQLSRFRWLQYNMALALCYAAVAVMAGMQVSRILYYKCIFILFVGTDPY